MFRHCVMVRFTDGATDEQKEICRAGIASLPDLIPEIVTYTVGFNAGDREDNFDLAAVGDFASKADYDVYASHPEHIRVVQECIAPISAGRAATQYEY
jgi:hypothetical protein